MNNTHIPAFTRYSTNVRSILIHHPPLPSWYKIPMLYVAIAASRPHHSIRCIRSFAYGLA
eukprot:31125-Pelagococcus_subviridis.AAC.28